MSEILNGWTLTLYKHVETWRDVYHSSDISQKTSPWQISVVMSAIAICWPKSWQNFNKRSAQIQKLSLRIQWEDIMRMCVVLSGGKQCKSLRANNNKLACFLVLLVKIIKIYQSVLIFLVTWKPGWLLIDRLLHFSTLILSTCLHLPSFLHLFSALLTPLTLQDLESCFW